MTMSSALAVLDMETTGLNPSDALASSRSGLLHVRKIALHIEADALNQIKMFQSQLSGALVRPTVAHHFIIFEVKSSVEGMPAKRRAQTAAARSAESWPRDIYPRPPPNSSRAVINHTTGGELSRCWQRRLVATSGRLRALNFIAAGPRSPKSLAPCTYMTVTLKLLSIIMSGPLWRGC
jgi:hypothetical protein